MKRLLTALALLLAAGAGFLNPSTARALEITCIEGSKYKYIYKIFGDDPKAFAAYLQLDPARLPAPEFCRAALISGPFEQNTPQEVGKVVEFILAQRGWLASLHLGSGGGSIRTGLQIGWLTRNFWLKTTVPQTSGGNLTYVPDVFVPPLPVRGGTPAPSENGPEGQLAAGWQAYLAEWRKLPPQLASNRCASACTFVLAAGIERAGIGHVHRGRFTGRDRAINQDMSMSVTNEGMMRSEAIITQFYTRMDAGSEFIRIYQATPTETVAPVTAARNPRYVSDYLNARCKADAAQLQRLEQQVTETVFAITNVSMGMVPKMEKLRASQTAIREQRSKVEACVAAAHEKERLSAFDRQCKAGCSREDLLKLASERIAEYARAER